MRYFTLLALLSIGLLSMVPAVRAQGLIHFAPRPITSPPVQTASPAAPVAAPGSVPVAAPGSVQTAAPAASAAPVKHGGIPGPPAWAIPAMALFFGLFWVYTKLAPSQVAKQKPDASGKVSSSAVVQPGYKPKRT